MGDRCCGHTVGEMELATHACAAGPALHVSSPGWLRRSAAGTSCRPAVPVGASAPLANVIPACRIGGGDSSCGLAQQQRGAALGPLARLSGGAAAARTAPAPHTHARTARCDRTHPRLDHSAAGVASAHARPALGSTRARASATRPRVHTAATSASARDRRDRPRSGGGRPRGTHSSLVDPASSHMLVSKIKPCMSQCKPH
jgi:hypothetical protein